MCLQVSAVPAVLAVKEGQVVGEFVGLRDTQFLEQFANDILTSPSHPAQ